MKKVLVSGVKPTGEIHFGNYFGAIKQNIDLANSGKYEAYIFVANYHALTTMHSGQELKKKTIELVASYIALGLDINKCSLFLQSDVASHTELSAIFNNLVTMPYMMRAHAFKDSEAKDKDINVGVFTYPILMAADILMYNADIVPVGQDQKQHIEYARDIAGYFNRAYAEDIYILKHRIAIKDIKREVDDTFKVNKEYFKLPKDYILPEVAIISGIDGEKMSKSKNNHIPIFVSDEEITKRVMSIVTDSARPEDKKDPDTNNIYNIHKYFLTKEEDIKLREKFINSSETTPYGYAQAKKELLETIMKFREGKYEKYLELLNDTEKLKEILKIGAENANKKAADTIKDIRIITGLDL